MTIQLVERDDAQQPVTNLDPVADDEVDPAHVAAVDEGRLPVPAGLQHEPVPGPGERGVLLGDARTVERDVGVVPATDDHTPVQGDPAAVDVRLVRLGLVVDVGQWRRNPGRLMGQRPIELPVEFAALGVAPDELSAVGREPDVGVLVDAANPHGGDVEVALRCLASRGQLGVTLGPLGRQRVERTVQACPAETVLGDAPPRHQLRRPVGLTQPPTGRLLGRRVHRDRGDLGPSGLQALLDASHPGLGGGHDLHRRRAVGLAAQPLVLEGVARLADQNVPVRGRQPSGAALRQRQTPVAPSVPPVRDPVPDAVPHCRHRGDQLMRWGRSSGPRRGGSARPCRGRAARVPRRTGTGRSRTPPRTG